MRHSALVLLLPALTAAANTPTWLPLSWMFSWDLPGTALPVPMTAQCETIHITWQTTGTGPDAVAPYYLQIYTSAFIFPFIIPAGSNPETDVTIPFAPGTQYQICMFDSNGNTGGCQAIYTVYPNTTSTAPTCANFSMPATTLNVLSESSLGPFSMYGFIDSCTDLMLTPLDGTPPFTFTVAPALHPPLNITSNDMKPINWTVALSWASPFFISLVDSTGLSWSNGPIHSGDGKTDCLAVDPPGASSHHGSVGVTVGAAISGAVLGTVFSILAVLYISKRRAKMQHLGDELEPTPFNPYNVLRSPTLDGRSFSHQQQSSIASTTSLSCNQSLRNPSSIKSLGEEHDMSQYDMPRRPTLPQRTTSDDNSRSRQEPWNSDRSPNANTSVTSPDRQDGPNQVYVIHHDSGRAPVSVITSQGTEVVELPPGYSSEYAAASGSSQTAMSAPTPKSAAGLEDDSDT